MASHGWNRSVTSVSSGFAGSNPGARLLHGGASNSVSAGERTLPGTSPRPNTRMLSNESANTAVASGCAPISLAKRTIGNDSMVDMLLHLSPRPAVALLATWRCRDPAQLY